MIKERYAIEEGFVKTRFGKTWFRVVGKSRATPLVCLHGGPGYPHDCMLNLQSLADTRPVVFYDQIGCGRSDPLPLKDWKISTFVYELDQLLKALKVRKLHLLGHSWGTMFGFDFARANSPRLSSFIFSSPCLSAKRWKMDADKLIALLPSKVRQDIHRCESRNETNSSKYKAAVRLYTSRHLFRGKDEPIGRKLSNAGFNFEGYLKMWGPSEFKPTGLLRTFSRERELRKFTVPSLFLCGEHDEARPETVRYYADQVPISRFAVVKGAAHNLALENPAAYLGIIRKFLREVEKR